MRARGRRLRVGARLRRYCGLHGALLGSGLCIHDVPWSGAPRCRIGAPTLDRMRDEFVQGAVRDWHELELRRNVRLAAPSSEPFDVSFSIDIWNDSWDPSPHLIGARVGLCNDSGLRSPNLPTVCPASDWLAPESTTDDEGRVTLHVTPVPGVGGPTVPRSHFYVGATPATPTQQYPTLDGRQEWNQPLRPVVGRSQTLVLPQGAPAVGRRFLCGIVLDCHGLRALSAEGLTASLENYNYPGYFMGYWDTDQGYHFDHTYLGGTFCAGISEDDRPTPESSGVFFINLDDTATLERRIRSLVTVPSDGNAVVVLFPPTSDDVQNQ